MEEVAFIASPELPGLELKSVYRSYRLWTRFNVNYAFSAMVQADSKWRYRRQTHAATPGTVVLMEPGETHVTVEARRPATFRALFIAPDLMDGLRRDLGWSQTPHFTAAYTRDPHVYAALVGLERLLDVPHSRLELDSRLLTCVRAVLCSGAESIPGDPPTRWEPAPIRRAQALLQERFAENLSLDDVAAGAALSPFYLLRLFRRHTGMTPHAYQLQVRLARAREMLKRSVRPGEVARLLGFFDQSHLTRHFVRTFGVSPGRYASSVQRH
jgi:AraC-like DNA-binding protein